MVYASRVHAASLAAKLLASFLLVSCNTDEATASPTNRAPTVSTGPDRTAPPATGVALNGVASDPDGDPLQVLWSGDGATFADDAALETTVTFSGVGSYTLTLSVSDGVLSAEDNLKVRVAETPTGTGMWKTLPPTSAARQEVSYVQLGGKFYLAGGSTLHEVYDPVAKTWRKLEPLPKSLDHIQGVTLGGKVYYIGGLAGWPGPAVATVYSYNPATDSFAEGAPLPQSRGAGGVAVYDGKIYYAGGLKDAEVQPSFYRYNPVADSWSELPDMPHPRDHFHAAVLNGVFYAVGGREAEINATIPFVDAFDFATQTWTTLETSLPTERGGFATAVLGNEILIIGGESGGTHAEVEAYTPATNSWRTLSPLPTPRHGIQAAVCSGGVYLAAGGVKQGIGPSTVHEVFSFGELEPCIP